LITVYIEYVCFVCTSCMFPHVNGVLRTSRLRDAVDVPVQSCRSCHPQGDRWHADHHTDSADGNRCRRTPRDRLDHSRRRASRQYTYKRRRRDRMTHRSDSDTSHCSRLRTDSLDILQPATTATLSELQSLQLNVK